MLTKVYPDQTLSEKDPMDNGKPSFNPFQEAGRKGGKATAAFHGKDFYKDIGRKGGKATATKHDKDFYKDIGRKGGEATAATHGKVFYQDIGQKGGGIRAARFQNAGVYLIKDSAEK